MSPAERDYMSNLNKLMYASRPHKSPTAYEEAYFSYVEKVSPRRTPLIKTREKGPFPDEN
jgi:hypothetical protein